MFFKVGSTKHTTQSPVQCSNLTRHQQHTTNQSEKHHYSSFKFKWHS